MSLLVVAILLAILVPALAASRSASLSGKSLANLRTIGQQIYLYADQYRDVLPFPDASAPFVMDLLGTGGGTRRHSHFDFVHYWYVMLRVSADPGAAAAVWLSPGTESPSNVADAGGSVGYAYSASLMAQPALWSPTPPPPEAPLTPVAISRVRHPSAKVAMWDKKLAFVRNKTLLGDGLWNAPTPMLFVDGHAASRHPADASAPVANPRDDNAGRASLPLHNTANGAEGADYN